MKGTMRMKASSQNREWIRVVKFTFFSISAGLVEIGAFALFILTHTDEFFIDWMRSLKLNKETE